MITSTWIAPGKDIGAAEAIREIVFMQELGITGDIVYDGMDRVSWNLVMNLDDSPVGCGRLTPVDVDTAQISRIAVLKQYRKQGFGDGIVKILLFKAANSGVKTVLAQVSQDLVGFAEGLGFQPEGDPYIKNQIKHYPMRKEIIDGCFEGCKD